jgi:chromosome segregation ATPase
MNQFEAQFQQVMDELARVKALADKAISSAANAHSLFESLRGQVDMLASKTDDHSLQFSKIEVELSELTDALRIARDSLLRMEGRQGGIEMTLDKVASGVRDIQTLLGNGR